LATRRRSSTVVIMGAMGCSTSRSDEGTERGSRRIAPAVPAALSTASVSGPDDPCRAFDGATVCWKTKGHAAGTLCRSGAEAGMRGIPIAVERFGRGGFRSRSRACRRPHRRRLHDLRHRRSRSARFRTQAAGTPTSRAAETHGCRSITFALCRSCQDRACVQTFYKTHGSRPRPRQASEVCLKIHIECLWCASLRDRSSRSPRRTGGRRVTI